MSADLLATLFLFPFLYRGRSVTNSSWRKNLIKYCCILTVLIDKIKQWKGKKRRIITGDFDVGNTPTSCFSRKHINHIKMLTLISKICHTQMLHVWSPSPSQLKSSDFNCNFISVALCIVWTCTMICMDDCKVETVACPFQSFQFFTENVLLWNWWSALQIPACADWPISSCLSTCSDLCYLTGPCYWNEKCPRWNLKSNAPKFTFF